MRQNRNPLIEEVREDAKRFAEEGNPVGAIVMTVFGDGLDIQDNLDEYHEKVEIERDMLARENYELRMRMAALQWALGLGDFPMGLVGYAHEIREYGSYDPERFFYEKWGAE
jgi:hypothetical protein